MLEQVNGTITESAANVGYMHVNGTAGVSSALTTTGCGVGSILTTDTIAHYNCQPYTYYLNYPVYVCQDKTKKAIDVLKALQADKLIQCKSVPRFIELVEKIANLL